MAASQQIQHVVNVVVVIEITLTMTIAIPAVPLRELGFGVWPMWPS